MGQCLQLQLDQTSAYEVYDCLFISARWSRLGPCLTLKWPMDPKSGETVDGAFDLTYWKEPVGDRIVTCTS